MYNFNLKHTALYAKNHYERGELIKDLKATLKADGYEPFYKDDIFNILLISYESIPYKGYSQIRNIVEGVSPENVWKVGYYTKGNCPYLNITEKEAEDLPQYDYQTAVIKFILSYLCMCEVSQLNGLTIPDKNVLPLRKK